MSDSEDSNFSDRKEALSDAESSENDSGDRNHKAVSKKLAKKDKSKKKKKRDKGNKKSKRHKGSDSEEEEEDDEEIEEEEDEEDEEEVKGGRKRKKSDRFGGFILEEAEVDDEVEDEEEWEDGAENYGVVGNEVNEMGPTAREIDGSRRRQQMWDSSKEEEVEEYFRKKYADEATVTSHFGDGGEDMTDEITQQTLLPGVKDPNLWMVKCRLGEEKQTVFQLMRKFIAYQFTEEPLQIKSIVAPEGVKGYIYVEAFKQTHVKQAIDGIGSLRMGLYAQQMVPIKEMTDVLRVVKEQSVMKPKSWVRLKRGIFKDDIAQVDYVDVAQNQVHLKLIPRIDYSRPRGALRTAQSDAEAKKEKKNSSTSKTF